MVNPTNCSTGPSPPGSNCTVVCRTGYQLYGQPRVTCASNGQWSGNVAYYFCRGVYFGVILDRQRKERNNTVMGSIFSKLPEFSIQGLLFGDWFTTLETFDFSESTP